AKFLERDMGQIQGLRAAVVSLPIHAILVVASGTALDALLGIEQQHRPRAEDDRSRGTHARTTGLQSLIETLAAQLTFRYAGVESYPLESRNLIRTRDGAIAAANALFGVPSNHAAYRIFV